VPPPNAPANADENGLLEPDVVVADWNDSPGAAVIVIVLDADVVWPVRVRNGVPAGVVIVPLSFQTWATSGCVSVAGIAAANAARLV